MNSQLVRRLLAIAVVLVLLTLAALNLVLDRFERHRQAAETLVRLRTAATLLASELERSPAAEVPARLAAVARARVEVIDPRAAAVDPGGDPELREAVQGRTGESVRRTESGSRGFVAVPLSGSAGVSRVLRLSAPLDDTAENLGQLRFRIFAICMFAAAIAMSIAFAVVRRLSGRIRRLNTSARLLLGRPVLDRGIDDTAEEIGSLERVLNAIGGQLRELDKRWRVEATRSEAILSSMAEGVLAVDREMRVVFCNQAVMRAIGANRPLAERVPLLELVRDSELVAILTQVVKTGETIKQNLKISAANGRVFEVQATPLSTSFGQGALAILYDLTDIERLEQVRKDFVANVSHEMRTPLASIVGYSETLLDGALEDWGNNRRFVEIIRSHAIRLNNIASDLLVLSELESGQNPGEPEWIQVADLLESAICTIEPQARSQGVQLIRGSIEDARVLGHRFRLEQAILNLLVNAVKFNREGGEVRVEARKNSERHIQIAVSDTGVGIPSQEVPRIFERFYRVDKARSRRVGGTGLGLSIVRHVVERMDGRVKVESQLGKGSTFTIILPAS